MRHQGDRRDIGQSRSCRNNQTHSIAPQQARAPGFATNPDDELYIAVGSRDGAFCEPLDDPPLRLQPGVYVCAHALMHRTVAHHCLMQARQAGLLISAHSVVISMQDPRTSRSRAHGRQGPGSSPRRLTARATFYLVPLGFELRFDQRQQNCRWPAQGQTRREHLRCLR